MAATYSPRRRRIVIVALAVALYWVGWWFLSPDFIELDVPVPQHQYKWKSQEEIVAQFEQWLCSHGWVIRQIYSEGDPVIPEAEFLGKSPAGVRHFTRPGDESGNEGRVALAVWPIYSGEYLLGYNVVLATVRPSFLRRLQQSFD